MLWFFQVFFYLRAYAESPYSRAKKKDILKLASFRPHAAKVREGDAGAQGTRRADFRAFPPSHALLTSTEANGHKLKRCSLRSAGPRQCSRTRTRRPWNWGLKIGGYYVGTPWDPLLGGVQGFCGLPRFLGSGQHRARTGQRGSATEVTKWVLRDTTEAGHKRESTEGDVMVQRPDQE